VTTDERIPRPLANVGLIGEESIQPQRQKALDLTGQIARGPRLGARLEVGRQERILGAI
jgi:hypothetical protein